jgi:hypothetical protein
MTLLLILLLMFGARTDVTDLPVGAIQSLRIQSARICGVLPTFVPQAVVMTVATLVCFSARVLVRRLS